MDPRISHMLFGQAENPTYYAQQDGSFTTQSPRSNSTPSAPQSFTGTTRPHPSVNAFPSPSQSLIDYLKDAFRFLGGENRLLTSAALADKLTYDLEVSQKLSAQILSNMPTENIPLSLLSYLEKQTGTLQKALEMDQDTGILNAALRKLLHRDFISKVFEAVLFEYESCASKTTFKSETAEMCAKLLAESVNPETLISVQVLFQRMAGSSNVQSVANAHAPVLSGILDLLATLRGGIDNASVPTNYREQYPKTTLVVDDIKVALGILLQSLNDQLSSWDDVEEQGWQPTAIEAKFKQQFANLTTSQYKIISADPDFSRLLLKDLEIHQILGNILLKDAQTEGPKLSTAHRDLVLGFYTLCNNVIMNHTYSHVQEHCPQQQTTDSPTP